MNDTGDQVTDTGADTSVQGPATVHTPEPGNKRNGEGWMRKGVLAGAIAALVVVVAAGFFTIGWFTSTRGEDRWQQNMSNERMNMNMRGWGDRSLPGRSQRGFGNQGRNQSQGPFGNGQGTVVPQQGQNGGQQSGSQAQTVPQSQSGSQQSNPSSQSYGAGQQVAPGVGGQQSTSGNQPTPSTSPSSTAPATPK